MASFRVSIAKVLATYAVAVAVITTIILYWGSYPAGPRPLTWREIQLAVTASAIFGLPVFAIIGLPFLGLGYASWGRENRALFTFAGTALGAAGGAAFGGLLAMPSPVPPIMIFIGGAAGLACSVCWIFLSQKFAGPRA